MKRNAKKRDNKIKQFAIINYILISNNKKKTVDLLSIKNF